MFSPAGSVPSLGLGAGVRAWNRWSGLVVYSHPRRSATPSPRRKILNNAANTRCFYISVTFLWHTQVGVSSRTHLLVCSLGADFVRWASSLTGPPGVGDGTPRAPDTGIKPRTFPGCLFPRDHGVLVYGSSVTVMDGSNFS